MPAVTFSSRYQSRAVHLRVSRAPVPKPSYFARCAALSAERGQQEARRHNQKCRAARDNNEGYDDSYVSATVESVRLQASNGPVICLKLEFNDSVLPVYVGDTEARSLLSGMSNTQPARPLSHDLFKRTLEGADYKVVLACITSLVGNTYHARMHISKNDNSVAYDVDARPSDAINMAVRFRAPIMVSKDVANKMGVPVAEQFPPGASSSGGGLSETHSEIMKSCQEECRRYRDPTVMEHLQLQLAVEEERYEEAGQLRDKIDHIIQSDRAMSLVVAIESAIEGKRFEEAARLRDELAQLRTVRSHPAD